MATIHHPPHNIRTPGEWTIKYTQTDVDTIRQQIVQDESAKRHWLVLASIIAVVALAGAIALLSTNYAMYSSAKAEKKRLADENAALKARADETQRQLEAKTAQEAKDAEASAEAQARLDKAKSSVLSGKAGGGEIASFARMVYHLPGRQVELSSRPPDALFRNWKVSSGSTIEIYALVGGFVDGKWVVYSNLIARRSTENASAAAKGK